MSVNRVRSDVVGERSQEQFVEDMPVVCTEVPVYFIVSPIGKVFGRIVNLIRIVSNYLGGCIVVSYHIKPITSHQCHRI